MAINNIQTALRTTLCDAFIDAIDDGPAAGIIELFTAAFGALLATLTFADPAFPAAVAGVGTANAIVGDASADASGTAVLFRISESTPNALFEGTVGSGSGDIDFNTNIFTAGDTIDITSMLITMPAS